MGMLLLGICGIWVIGATGILGGFASKTKLVKTVIRMFRTLFGTYRFAAISTVAFVVYPLVLGLLVLAFGCLLASVESWKWFDGCFYILANVASLPNPLVPDTPEGEFGKLFDTIVSAWCFVFAGILVGLASNLEFPKELRKSPVKRK
eukprot:CAMPEP_0169200932 /NCGR_PEP_ID=MMETSP1016-20121227/10135_1 /TAXON_ID=342587 /ORGANISM="Karlodinium micrum, Strain CCMP2283" /LENGTH=147 /DNA_ID=CAMNT_0009277819 /DNA_START=311 /DNA_END=751 /DNA_ORIENTATION=+